MPVQVYKNQNRFKTIRSGATIVNDAPVPPVSSFPNDQRFDSDGCEHLILYWTATTPTGTPTFTVYVWDADTNMFVKGDVITAVPANTLVKIPVHGAANALIHISAVGGGTNFKINAFGWDA